MTLLELAKEMYKELNNIDHDCKKSLDHGCQNCDDLWRWKERLEAFEAIENRRK